MLSQLINTLLSWDASTWAAIIAAIAALIPIGIDLWRSWNVKQEQKKLEAEFGRGVYLPEDIERSIKYYVEPDCSSVDPAREDEIRNLVAPTQRLFEVIDDFLAKDSVYRHMIILADSGMGKTSALINYYARNRQRRKKYKIALIPLGREDADKRIKQLIDDHKGDVTDIILFLDAFDEDTLAIVDHKERLTELMKVCKDFKRIILTCRTQFFLSDEEIPVEPGTIRVASRKAGEGARYTFQRLYLTPFSDKIVNRYLRKRYRWNWRRRRKAKKLVDKVPQLNVRPMLLANIPDLLDSQKEFKYSYELYEALINAWIEREDRWIPTPEKLRHFSERLAVDLFVNREKRAEERIPIAELEPLAKKWEIDLNNWQITGRSLLNRDAAGNYKFAHRSIMEYLFLTCDTTGLGIDWHKVELTDQMHSFIHEGVASFGVLFKNMPKAILNGANLSNAELNSINLYSADLSNANLSRADLSSTYLRSANLSGATLRGAKYDGKTQWPKGFDFRQSGAIGPGANLNGADLSGTDLSSTDLSGVNLSGAKYDSKTQWPKGFIYINSGAIGPHAHLSGADLSGADLSKADLSSANLSSANLSSANLSSANLGSTNLYGTNLGSTNLSGVNLRSANLDSTNLSGADLSGANLRSANLYGANLSNANLSGANLSNTDLNKANLIGANLRSADLRSANNLDSANLDSARHDNKTQWPKDFDPRTVEVKINDRKHWWPEDFNLQSEGVIDIESLNNQSGNS